LQSTSVGVDDIELGLDGGDAPSPDDDAGTAGDAAVHTHFSNITILLENLSSLVDVHTLAGGAFHNRVTLTFDLLTSGSMHAEQLPLTACLPTLLLIVEAFLLLKRGHTDRRTHTVTDATYITL